MGRNVLVAPDKFKGTIDAATVAALVGEAARDAGWEPVLLPMADGGEGTLSALGGANRWSTVRGPLGESARAAWRLDGHTAVIEMAQAAGLTVAGGAEANDPIAASTYGVGQLIVEADAAGASEVIVAVGGSATTDGGGGALQAIADTGRALSCRIRVACDVRTRFVDAAAVFGPQKGASPEQVALLRERLEHLVVEYGDRYGVDLADLPGSGAAGGLAGGLAAIGAELVPGFDLVAEQVGFDAALGRADLVVSGEGRFDASSLDGKVVGGVSERAAAIGCPTVAFVGQADAEVDTSISVVSLADRFGAAAALADPETSLRVAAGEWFAALDG